MTPSATQPSRDAPLRGVVLMLLASASFATMNTFGGGLSRAGVPWTMIAFARAITGLVATLAFARSRGASLKITKPRVMWLRSIAGSTGILMTFYSLAHLPLSDATALLNTTPLWLALLAWFTLREAPGIGVVVAIAIGASGIALIERPSLAVGDLAGLVALCTGLTGALAMMSLRRLADETPEAVVVHFSSVSVVFTGVAMTISFAHRGAYLPSVSQAIGLLATGLCATIGQLLMTRAYALDRAARVGATGWMQVVFALVLDRVVMGRTPPVTTVGGIACVVSAGVLLVFDAQREQAAKQKAAASSQ